MPRIEIPTDNPTQGALVNSVSQILVKGGADLGLSPHDIFGVLQMVCGSVLATIVVEHDKDALVLDTLHKGAAMVLQRIRSETGGSP